MHPEEKFLLACIRHHVGDSLQDVTSDTGSPRALDWEVVHTVAQQHGVAPLVHAVLQQDLGTVYSVPQDIQIRFEQAYVRNVGIKAQASRHLARILTFFNARRVNVMLIKGAACDLCVYAQPWYTTHDVDLVIGARRETFSSAELGEIQALFSTVRGFEYDFYEHHDVTMNRILPVNFEQIWADAQQIDFRGHDVWVMCPEDMLLAACINSCRKRYFRLKSLLDIAEIMRAHPALDWASFVHKASVYECEHIAYTALLISSELLDLNVADVVLAPLSAGSARHRLIRYLSRRMSLAAFSSIHTDGHLTLHGRRIGAALLLPYLTLHWDQVYRKVQFALTHDRQGQRRHILRTGGPLSIL